MKKKENLLLFIFIIIALSFLLNINCKRKDDMTDPTPESKFVSITNASIEYKIYGSGDPIIMCIGYATNMDMWSTKVIEMLQQKYKVIVFNYRGMGYSTNQDTSFTIQTLANDVNELLMAININKAHVLGWSMGGYVAQKFAITYPDKVNKLILYATNIGDTATVNPSQEIIDILSNPASTPMQMLGTLFPDDWLAIHPEPWTFIPESKVPFNGETIGLQYYAVQEWLSENGGSSGHLSAINMPVLLICGDQDKVVPCINSSMLADSLSAATLIRVDNSGHGLMYQLPEVFSNYIISFLNE